MKILHRTFLVEYEGSRYRVEFNASGVIAHRIQPRNGVKEHVDFLPLDATDPALPALSSLGDECVAADPNASRYRDALTNLSACDGSGFTLPSQVADSVRAYCRDVLNGAKVGT